jgi:hypothetical protein
MKKFLVSVATGLAVLFTAAVPAHAANTYQSITWSSVPSSMTVGNTATLSARASSGLSVSYSSLTSTVCTVSGSTVTARAGGNCTVQVRQAGSKKYYATSSNRTFTVYKRSQTVSLTGPRSLVVGGSGTLSVSASSGLGVSISSQTPAVCTTLGTRVSALTGGTCIIKASQSGNSYWYSALDFHVFEVNRRYNVIHRFKTPTSLDQGDKSWIVADQTSLNPVRLLATSDHHYASLGSPCSLASPTANAMLIAGKVGGNRGALPCMLRAYDFETPTWAAPLSITRSITIFSTGPISTNPDVHCILNCKWDKGQASYIFIVSGLCYQAYYYYNWNIASDIRVWKVKCPQWINFPEPSDRLFSYSRNFTLTVRSSVWRRLTMTSLTPSVCTVSGNAEDDPVRVRVLAIGDCTLRASQNGDADTEPASPVTRTFRISRGVQSLTFTGFYPAIEVTGTRVVTATTPSNLPVTYTSLSPNVCTVAGNVATGVGVGNCVVQASQTGNSFWRPAANVSLQFPVTARTQTITFGALSTLQIDQTQPLSASASSGMAVTFTSSTPGVCSVSGSTVTAAAAGTCTVVATQAGGGVWAPASQSASFTVTKVNQTISFSQVLIVPIGAAVELEATASSGLAVTFISLSPSICTVSGTKVTGVAPGSCVIAANQAGNTKYNAAPEVRRTLTTKTGDIRPT